MFLRNVVDFQRSIQRCIAEDITIYNYTAYALNVLWQQLKLDFGLVHVASVRSDTLNT
jgi:hypothetical protein